MNLKNLVSIIKSGNIALGHKLNNVLTDNCSILEYTDDSVLFTQNNYLVLAKFNHPLTEASLTAENILDNEIIRISLQGTKKELKNTLKESIYSLVDENFVKAEASLKQFCETYYHYFVLNNRYPGLFTESLSKNSKGYKLRKKANDSLADFKSEIFSLVSINESKDIDIEEYSILIESYGHILFLGKKKLLPVVVDALLGNEALAEAFVDKFYTVAKELNEANEELHSALESGFDLENGKFPSEEDDEIAEEDFEDEMPEEDFEDELSDEGPQEAEEFNIEKLSDVELKQLHKDVLVGILSGMRDFVARESNDPSKTDIPADLDEKLNDDLAELEKDELSDDVLASIEAHWQPILSYFLDSDLYKPEQELAGDDVDIEDVVPGGEDAEDIDSGVEDLAVPNEQPAENLPPEGQAQNTMPPAPLGTENPEELKNRV